MENNNKTNKHLKVTRCILMAQLFLESLDDIKTTAYYRQDLKKLTNTLERKLESFLSKPNEYMLNGEAEKVMMILARGFENLRELELEEIYDADHLNKS